MGNKNAYEFTDVDVNKIAKALIREVEQMASSMNFSRFPAAVSRGQLVIRRAEVVLGRCPIGRKILLGVDPQRRFVSSPAMRLDLTKHLLRRIATEADVIGLPFFQVARLRDGHSSVCKNFTIC
jgi:hypothetical protein